MPRLHKIEVYVKHLTNYQVIKEAADFTEDSLSGFVLKAALEKARHLRQKKLELESTAIVDNKQAS